MNYGDRPLTIPPQEGGTPETERSIRALTEAGLPALQGTPTDIEAARAIRLNKLIAADDVLTALRTNEQQTELGEASAVPPESPVSESQVQAAQRALNQLRHQEEALWWLARRECSARELVELFLEGQTLPLPDETE
jgi:hypothetical protein